MIITIIIIVIIIIRITVIIILVIIIREIIKTTGMRINNNGNTKANKKYLTKSGVWLKGMGAINTPCGVNNILTASSKI